MAGFGFGAPLPSLEGPLSEGRRISRRLSSSSSVIGEPQSTGISQDVNALTVESQPRESSPPPSKINGKRKRGDKSPSPPPNQAPPRKAKVAAGRKLAKEQEAPVQPLIRVGGIIGTYKDVSFVPKMYAFNSREIDEDKAVRAKLKEHYEEWMKATNNKAKCEIFFTLPTEIKQKVSRIGGIARGFAQNIPKLSC